MVSPVKQQRTRDREIAESVVVRLGGGGGVKNKGMEDLTRGGRGLTQLVWKKATAGPCRRM